MTSNYPDNPPQLGSIPTLDDSKGAYGGAPANGTGSTTAPTSSFADSAQSALNSVTNHPVAQDVKNTVGNGMQGPVGQSVKNQYAATANEFQNVANSRTRPADTTATGQPLTHYHSMFYNLLSWENPRVTGLAFLSSVIFIFAARYINILHYFFKFTYLILAGTAAAEIVGKTLFSTGFASQIRPRRYYTLPRESVDRFLDDFHELMNFFVIEFQRIIFAEKVSVTVAACIASFTSFILIKIVPVWGLSLIATTVLYAGPWVYLNNKEVIDAQIQNGSEILNKQAVQVKQLAEHHTARASDTVKTYAGDYSAKAQGYMGSVRQRTTTPNTATGSGTKVKSSDFPSAPQTGLNSTPEKTPLAAI